MMRLLVTAVTVTALAVLLMVVVPEEGEAYFFDVEREYVEVYIRTDGSIHIFYEIDFLNMGDMDGVDIGLPNRHYDEDSAEATILVDGMVLKPEKIHPSPYVDIGLAVEFDGRTQRAVSGAYDYQEFTLRFSVNNPHMVYENEKEEGTAGIVFRPTWFDPNFQYKNTKNLTVVVFFPKAYDGKDPLWLESNPWHDFGYDDAKGRYRATWSWEDVNPNHQANGQYDVGVAFDDKWVDKVYTHGLWEALSDFMYATWVLVMSLLPCCVTAVIVTSIVSAFWYRKRRRMEDYYEPTTSVKGAGPRRDLTAVEAAVVLERPISMVATMILFGLIKKGNVKVVDEVSPIRLKRLSSTGAYKYETDYLKAIDENGHVHAHRLSECLVQLVLDTQTKMRGFDHDMTRQYYDIICEEAWTQVQMANTPEEFAMALRDRNEWMMLDRRYRRKLDHTTDEWYDVHDTYDPRKRDDVIFPSDGPKVMDLRGMARDYTTRVKDSSRNMVMSMRDVSREVTKITNPLPQRSKSSARSYDDDDTSTDRRRSRRSSSSSWSSGSSWSSSDFSSCDSCDCACACACACAGGGR
jgi:hypothetical protein